MARRPERCFTDEVCQPFYFKGGRHGVLLIHGFTGSAAHMRPLGEALHAKGFTVQSINLPGHAVSMEAMARTGWQDWLDAAKEAFLRLKAECEVTSVAGLSMGGVLSLLIAEQMDPAAVASISAPMGMKNRLLPLARLVAPFKPTIWWQGRKPGSNLDLDYDYGYPGTPTRCGYDLLRLVKMARRNLHAIHCPLLAVQSRADGVIIPESADIIVQGVSSAKAGTLWLEGVPHACTISDKVPVIAQAVGDLFREAEQQL